MEDVKKFDSQATFESDGISIIRSNLEEIESRTRALAEAEYAQISELWRMICDRETIFGTDRMITLISEIYSIAESPSETRNPTHSADDLPKFCSLSSKASKKAIICVKAARLLEENKSFSVRDILGYFEDVPEAAKNKIACIRSEHIEDAYQCLSHFVSDAKVSYFSSYEDAAEALYNGFSEYCILPIRNSAEGKLGGFYALIDKYELKIAAVCSLQSKNKEFPLTTEYALLTKEYIISGEQDIRKSSDKIEISLHLKDLSTVGEIISVADLIGMKTVSIDSVHADDYLMRFSSEKCDILPFLLYLTAFLPDFIPIGIFSTVKKRHGR